MNMQIKRHKKKDSGVGVVISKSRHELYAEELKKKFLSLPKKHRDFIIAAKEDGIEWKGEDTYRKLPQLDNLTHFEHLVREYGRMQDMGPAKYKILANRRKNELLNGTGLITE
jgi:hypothetical protein